MKLYSSLVVGTSVIVSVLLTQCTAFVVTSTIRSIRTRQQISATQKTPTTLMYLSERHESLSDSSEVDVRRRATQFAGVSLSTTGFWVILKVACESPNCYLPVRVTSNPLDSRAATSPEALTILQLLGNIDMAGALLPPDVLSKLVVLACEQSPSSVVTPVAASLLQAVHANIPMTAKAKSYTELHAWFRSKIGLPISTLDEVWIQYQDGTGSNNDEQNMDVTSSDDCPNANLDLLLHIYVDEFGKLALKPAASLLEQVLYQRDEATSGAFLAIALALRYKAPLIVLDYNDQAQSLPLLTAEDLSLRFPMYTTVDNIQKKSVRVTNNIEQAYKVHQLQAALKMAIEKNDLQAATKIRAKLDEYDAMDQLPVKDIREDSDLDAMQ